ncbi:MAG: TIGR01244 family sulfur transferase [Methyloligellaceae bacterium]
MNQIAPLSETMAVTGQIGPEDFAALKALGFRSVINNRPDGEGADAYLPAAEAAAIARRHGLDYAHLPANGLNLTDDETVEAFERLVASLPGPVLAHCKTGTRSAILWALAQTRETPVEEILESTAQAGLELSVIRPDLLERAERVGLVPHPPAPSASWPQQTLEDCQPAG